VIGENKRVEAGQNGLPGGGTRYCFDGVNMERNSSNRKSDDVFSKEEGIATSPRRGEGVAERVS